MPKTFQYQESLPPLPVPDLQETCDRFLKSCLPILSREEYQQTKEAVNKLLNGQGKQLQQRLLQFAKKMQKEKWNASWLEDLWDNWAYLAWREPILVNVNFFMVSDDHPLIQQGQLMPQERRAAIALRNYLEVRDVLEREELEPQCMGPKNIPLDMDQYRKIFGVARLAEKGQDRVTVFKDSRHFVVLAKNHFFSLDCYHPNGNLLSIHEFECQLDRILRKAENLGIGVAVGTLTGQHRDIWAEMKENISQYNPENKRNFQIIDSALGILCLDDSSPVTDDEAIEVAYHNRDASNRWLDKSSLIVTKNSRIVMNGEHSPYEATQPGTIQEIGLLRTTLKQYYENYGEASLIPRDFTRLPEPEHLKWTLNKEHIAAANEALEHAKRLTSSVQVTFCPYYRYGSDFLKQVRLAPDAYVQMAIQLAYWRVHKKPMATYETASTRQFYHGRTETCRTLSVDSLAFTKGMLNPSLKNSEKFSLLKKAIGSHIEYMRAALSGKGCDRHLLGLSQMVQSGEDMPEIFFDPGFLKSSHFGISTSNISPSNHYWGGFGPVKEDGYGCCYVIGSNFFKLTISSKTTCQETDSFVFKRALVQSLDDMYEVSASFAKL